MICSPIRLAALLLAGLLAAAGGCTSAPKTTLETKVGNLTVAQIQSQVMGFSDTYTSLVAQAADRVMYSSEDPIVRSAAVALKLMAGNGSWTIASNPNAVVGLLDMVIMVDLQRDSFERHVGPQIMGPENSAQLERVYDSAYREIRAVADDVFTNEELDRITQLIQAWRAEHPDQWYVSHVRFTELSSGRQTAATTSKTGGSLFGLVGLDPLAKMDPVTRQVEQSRLLAERAFFYGSRVPSLMAWQVQGLFLQLVNTPEATRLRDDLDAFADAVKSYEDLAGNLPTLVAEERNAALLQANELLTNQRRALLADIEAGSATLGELNATIEAGTALSESLTRTIDAADALAARFEKPEPESAAAPAREPIEMDQLRATLAETAAAVQDANELILSVERLLTAPEAEQRVSDLQASIALAERSGARLVNRTFLLAAGLVVLIFAASIVRLLVGRRAGRGHASRSEAYTAS